MPKQGNNYQTREVAREDSKRVWEIRNHPLCRQNFNNPKEIPWENHKSWFAEKYFSGQDNHCFVLADNKKVIGYCRFDFDEEQDAYIISIALDPDNQGKGWGSKLLSESLQAFKGEHPILAEIKKQNIPSIKLFQKNNFKTYKEDENNFYLKYEI